MCCVSCCSLCYQTPTVVNIMVVIIILLRMEELKNEVTLLRAERDHLEESLAGVNKKMCFLQNAQAPVSIALSCLCF